MIVDARPVVAVYRSELVRRGEPFVLEQPAALQRYRAVIVGAHRLSSGSGMALPADAYVVGDERPLGTARATALKLTGYAPRLTAHLSRAKARIIHAHFGPEGVRCLSLARRLDIPLVTTYHGFDATRRDATLAHGPWGERVYLRMRNRLARRGALHIAVSNYLRRCLVERGFPAERVILHYIGVNTRYFVPPERQRDRDLIVCVGRVAADKGCLDAVEVLARLARHGAHRLVFVGDGPERSAVESTAERLRLDVTITGFATREEVRSWLQRATLMLAPSRCVDGEREAFGLAFAEAQSTGVPVVGYATGGIPEAVAHGETGVLCREGDIDALEHAATALLDDDGYRARLGRAAVIRMRQSFDLERQARGLEDLYDAVRQEESS